MNENYEVRNMPFDDSEVIVWKSKSAGIYIWPHTVTGYF